MEASEGFFDMRRWFVWILLLAMLGGCAAASEELSIDAKAAVLIDAASGRILYAKNENEMLPMASCTKIMTALLALEHSSPDEKVTAGKNAHGVAGTSIYLSEGETLTMEQMLYGLMLRSGNDAAVAIAEHIAGSIEAFCGMADERADELDADARFKNPHGLDAEGHAASALGLARIMRQAMKNEDFRTITGTEEKIIPWVGNEYSRVLQNKNRLLSSYEGTTGGKTGYTSKAGRCLVFSAERDGLELIGVVLNCYDWFNTAEKLLDYGFKNYRMETALQAGEPAALLAVTGGERDTVPIAAEADLSGAVRRDGRSSIKIRARALHAPAEPGMHAGTAYLMDGGTAVNLCSLVTTEGVAARGLGMLLKKLIRSWLLRSA